jgi:hypothetical protein
MRKPKRSDVPEREIIDACNAFHNGTGPTPDVALAHKYPVKVILAKMDQMSDKGILNYGVSLRTSWVENDPYNDRPPDIPPLE